jgi:uncharacterized protein YeaO (DUF488 family)
MNNAESNAGANRVKPGMLWPVGIQRANYRVQHWRLKRPE